MIRPVHKLDFLFRKVAGLWLYHLQIHVVEPLAWSCYMLTASVWGLYMFSIRWLPIRNTERCPLTEKQVAKTTLWNNDQWFYPCPARPHIVHQPHLLHSLQCYMPVISIWQQCPPLFQILMATSNWHLWRDLACRERARWPPDLEGKALSCPATPKKWVWEEPQGSWDLVVLNFPGELQCVLWMCHIRQLQSIFSVWTVLQCYS